MNIYRSLLCVFFFFLLTKGTSCSSVRSGKEASGHESVSDMSSAVTPVAAAAPPVSQKTNEIIPEPVLPEGVSPFEYEKIPEVPLLQVPVQDVVAAVPQLGREVWYGVYVMNQKVGAMSSAWAMSENGKTLVQKQTFRMEMNVLGGKKVLDLTTTITYGADSGDLLEHYTEQKADHLERTIRLVRRPDGSLIATVKERASGQEAAPEREYIPNRPLGGLQESDLAFSVVLQRGPDTWNANKAWRTRKFMSMDISVAHEVGRVVSSVQKRIGSKRVAYHVVETVSDNPKSRVVSVYDQNGILWISRVGSIEMRREDVSQARVGMGGHIDTGINAIIPLHLENPHQLEVLVLQLEGPFAVPNFLNTLRYRLEILENGKKKLTLTKDTLEGWEKPVPDQLQADIKKYLAAEPNIESDDSEIIALAKKAAGKAYRPVDVVRAVVDFVGDYVQDTMRSDIDSARMVSRMQKGDCTEHSILATALLRALGFPARQVGGVGFVKMCRTSDDCVEGLGYHAWTQVWVGRWVDVDPTWKQTPADVTHVLMGTTTDMQWLESLGKLKVFIVEKVTQK